MQIKRYFAADSRKALRLVKEELGPDAIIISNRQVEDGVEVLAARDFDEELSSQGEYDTRNATLISRPAQGVASKPEANGSAPTGKDSAKNPGLLNIPHASRTTPASGRQTSPRPKASRPAETVKLSDHEQAMNTMRDELNKLRGLMENQFTALHVGQWSSNSPVRTALMKQLTRLGLSNHLAGQIIGSLKEVEKIPLQAATRNALTELSQRIKITHDDILKSGGIIVLIGPAGAGKTTTLAKLAAQFAKRHNTSDIILVSTDNQRIGAHEQLLAWGQLFNIPVLKARDNAEIGQILAATSGKRLVLVDSGSLTQQDLHQPNQLPTLRTGLQGVKHYLVMPATNQISTLERVLGAFPKAQLKGCILTKVDEASNLGGALTAVIRSNVPIAYWTDGQRATADLHPATQQHLIARAVAMAKDQNYISSDTSAPGAVDDAQNNFDNLFQPQ